MRINVADVTTPDARYVRAKVDIEPDFMVILNRRNEVLARYDAPQVVQGGSYRYGEVWITPTGGCGCGQVTEVTPL